MRKITTLFSCLIFAITLGFAQDYERYNKHLDTSFYSEALGYTRDITVTVPLEWQREIFQEFPLIVVFDQQNPRSHGYILNTIDYLTSNEQMPSAVVVSIASDQAHRYIETLHKISNEKGKAADNERFLFEELIPWLEEDYEISDYHLFIGHSRYGYFTTSMLNSRAEDVNAVIALSPFFFQKNVDLTDTLEKVIQEELPFKRYYTFGIGNDYPEQYDSMMLVVNQNTNPNLIINDYFFEDATHNVTPGLIIAPALYNIFEYWSTHQNIYFFNEGSDLKLKDSLEQVIFKHYGSSFSFSLGILNGKGWHHYGKEEYHKAIEAWRVMLENYPNFTEGYLYILESQIILGEDVEETVKSFQKSLNSSTLFNEAEKMELLKAYDELILQLTNKEN